MSYFSANLAILFPLAASLYIGMRLSDGQVDNKGGGWARALVYTLVAILVSFALAGILIRISPLSLIWIFVLSFLCVFTWIKSRAINRSFLLHSLMSADSDIIRERMAADFIELNGPLIANRVSIFQDKLAKGKSWALAIEQSKIARSTSEIFACRCVDRFGLQSESKISPALDPLRIQAETEKLLGRLMVMPWAIFGFATVVPLMMWLVIPTFKAMFDEFGLTLPRAMLSFIAMSDFTVNSPLSALLILLQIVLLFIGFLTIWFWMFPRQMIRYPFCLIAAPYFRAMGLVSMAMSVRKETTFSAACDVAGEVIPVPFMSRRLQFASRYHAQGLLPDVALSKAGLLRPIEAELLKDSMQSKSFPWAIEQIAINATESMLRFYSIAIQLLIVFFVCFFSFFVGWLAVGVIGVLAKMITSLS
jgi:type II secretory pathway component PulF